ncbi:MAG: T9SS type A sorting domain-containing protein [bacterium]
MSTIKKLLLIILVLSVFTFIESFAQCTPYLGQTPPTVFVKKFPPNNLLSNTNWEWHGTPIFSPDGDEMFFAKIFSSLGGIELWYIKCLNGVWAEAQKAPFSDAIYSDTNPVYLGNDTLYFLSIKRTENFIYQVTRTPTGWSSPVPLNIPIPHNSRVGLQFSITNNKTVYFEAVDTVSGNNINIFKSEFINNQYATAENIGFPINTENNEFVGYVDPEERFMIFLSFRAGGLGMDDLYVSKRNANDTWSTPINLGSRINSVNPEIFPAISPDGLYLFFTSNRYGDMGYNPYWIKAQFVYDLITDVEDTSFPLIDFALNQNYPNPFNPQTVISYYLPERNIVSIKIYDILGKELGTLIEKEQNAGTHKINFDASNLTGGVYFYQIISGNHKETKKMIFLK